MYMRERINNKAKRKESSNHITPQATNWQKNIAPSKNKTYLVFFIKYDTTATG
jgi:hypothetical protein